MKNGSIKTVVKWLIRTLFRLLAFLMLVIMFVTAAALVVLRFPGLVVNDRTFAWAARKFGPADFPVSWSSEEVTARSESWLRKDFSFRFSGLCVNESAKHALRACFDSARIEFQASLEGFVPRVTVLGPIGFWGGDVRADLDRLPKSPEKPQSRRPAAPFQIPVPLRSARIEPIRIEVSRIQIASGDRSLRGSAYFDERIQPGGGARIALEADADALDTGATGRNAPHARADTLRASVSLTNPDGMVLSKGWRVDASAAARVASGIQAELRADARQGKGGEPFAREWLGGARGSEKSRVDFHIEVSYRQARKRARGTILGSVGWDGLDARLEAQGTRLIQGVDRLRVSGCSLTARPWGSDEHRAAARVRYALDCPMRASIPLPPRSLSLFEIPTELGLRLKGGLDSSTVFPSSESRIDGDLVATLDPVLAPLFRGGGTVRTRIDGRVSEFSNGRSVEAETELFVSIPSFEKLVHALKGTEWDVPAPLRVLRGSFEAEARGRTDLREGYFPSRFDMRLKSKTEAVKIDASSSFEFTRREGEAASSSLKATVVLNDVQLELPRLDLAAPPRIVPDARIGSFKREKPRARQEAGTAAQALAYEATVSTPPKHPVRILSNLAAAPIPVALDLALDKEGRISGPIRIERFPVVLFRQKATIDHFTLTLKEPREASEVDGLVKVPYSNYTILIYIVGTVDKPRVRFDSDPPVPSNQLISVLLYGESSDELSSAQNSSVGNTQAALSQGAMGLASLYLFASTPIQSVLYDPTTGQVTARVSLGGGTTLNLGGSGSQLQTVGVRKQLGPAWAITTSVDPSRENPGSEAVSALLEWIHRY